MLLRAAWIWIMHGLAFLAGLVVNGVAAGVMLSLISFEGPTKLRLALGASILAMGIGYALYLAIVSALCDFAPGWGFYGVGSVVVLGVMGGVYLTVAWGYLTVLQAGLALYLLLFVLGGVFLMRRLGLFAEGSEE
jgi:hypothetical protein